LIDAITLPFRHFIIVSFAIIIIDAIDIAIIDFISMPLISLPLIIIDIHYWLRFSFDID
jgi:hypothetical protein